MSLKKITSLSILLSMIVMTYTGIMLFIAPAGRIANWANWKILGLTKDDYAQLHATFMVLFVVMILLHIYYNFKPLVGYLKNKTKELIFFTKEMLVALVLTFIFIIGVLANISPFSTFLAFEDGVKNSWEKEYGTAPYAHAELASLQAFSKKLGFDLEKSKTILASNNIKFEQTQSLSQIGEENKVSPQFIYNILKKNFEKEGVKVVQLTGLGKKTIEEVAMTLQISTKDLISKLKTLGIEAKKSDKFKQAVEKYDLSPMQVLEKLGYKKPE